MKRLPVCLLWITLALSGCTKIFIEPFGEEIAEELWEDRPDGISCEPEESPNTLVDRELTFAAEHMLCIQIEMNADDFERMRNESRFGPSIQDENGATAATATIEQAVQCDVAMPSEYNWYSGHVTIDGLMINNVGLRKKGFLGSIFSVAPSIKINTNQFVVGQQLSKAERITLNNNAEDQTRLVQVMNYAVFAWADYPAPRCNLANVSVNGEALGVYSHLEAIDHHFLQRNFGNSTGQLYEGQLADFVLDWLPRWDAKTDVTDEAARPLRDIIQVVEEASDEELLRALEPHLNLDRYFTFWALEVLLHHVDGYAVNRNNFYIYLDPADQDRITFVPWGMNSFFGAEQSTDLSEFVGAELPRRLSRHPEAAQRMEQELQRLLNEVWNEDRLFALVDQFEPQVRSAQDDDGYTREVDELKSWIQTRRNHLTNLLNAGLPEGNAEQADRCYSDEG